MNISVTLKRITHKPDVTCRLLIFDWTTIDCNARFCCCFPLRKIILVGERIMGDHLLKRNHCMASRTQIPGYRLLLVRALRIEPHKNIGHLVMRQNMLILYRTREQLIQIQLTSQCKDLQIPDNSYVIITQTVRPGTLITNRFGA